MFDKDDQAIPLFVADRAGRPWVQSVWSTQDAWHLPYLTESMALCLKKVQVTSHQPHGDVMRIK